MLQLRGGNGVSTVRVNDSTHKALRQLAKSERVPLQTVVERAVEHYRRQRFLATANQQYAALRSDTAAWAAERGAWDHTLADEKG